MTLLSQLEQMALNPLKKMTLTTCDSAEKKLENNIAIRDSLASELISQDKYYAVYASETKVF